MKEIKIIERKLIMTIFGYAGIVIYPNIYMLDKNNPRVLYHELIHITQIKRLIRKYGKKGIRMFYFNYLKYWILSGFKYRKILYEIEAFQHQTDYGYLKYNDPEIWEEIKHLMIDIPDWVQRRPDWR
jgi:hypothetical protein